jgi:hypothetical protein
MRGAMVGEKSMTMTRDGFEVHIINDGQGAMVGYVFQQKGGPPGYYEWGAILDGFCPNCSPEKELGWFPDFVAAAVAIAATLKTGLRQ